MFPELLSGASFLPVSLWFEYWFEYWFDPGSSTATAQERLGQECPSYIWQGWLGQECPSYDWVLL